MTRMIGTVLAAVLVLWVTPARAQSASAPTVNLWYVGANAGAAAVENVSGVFGLEGGVRIWRSLDAVGELQWFSDVVTGRQVEYVATLSKEMQKTQTLPVTSTITAPAFFGGLGFRYVLEQGGRFRPYGIVTIGGTRVNLKPELSIGGSNVTDSAASYGVTLGQDVIGKYNRASVSAGVGLAMPYGKWYFDGGARLVNISSPNQPARAIRLVLGGGRRF